MLPRIEGVGGDGRQSGVAVRVRVRAGHAARFGPVRALPAVRHAYDAIGVFLAGNLLCAFAPNYAVLMAGRILIALVSGTLVAIAMTYAPDVTTDTFRTKFIAWVFSGFSIASVVGVPVGTWVANAFGWRWAFHLVNALTVVLIIGMVAVLPRNSHAAKIGFLSQFRLFFDRRIQLGVLDVVCGAAASYVFYTYLTPIMRDEVHVPEQYLSVGLVIFGAACLWSNLYGGKLADRGRGVEPLTHIRPIYCAHAVLMASLIVAHWVAVLAAAVRTPLAVFAGVMVASLFAGLLIRESQLFRFFKKR